MPGWDTLKALVEYEFIQSTEEGKSLRAIESLREQFAMDGDDDIALALIHRKLLDLPQRPDFEFIEPSSLDEIRALRGAAPPLPNLSFDDGSLLDRLYGAWLGRCCGCALGKPVEGWSREEIRTYLSSSSPSEYPLAGYFPGKSGDRSAGCPQSTRELIRFMETDDDIRYTVIGQIVLSRHGLGFTSRDVAESWLRDLTYGQMCTAETQAYRNLVTGYDFHCSHSADDQIDWLWVATHQNPYREWIGAQIRADQWAYAAPGNPELAAELAWRDARMSHVKNGIYGEMLCAAMIAAAFATDDPHQIVEHGLAQIPSTSRLHADIRRTVDLCAKYDSRAEDFEAITDGIYELLGHYHWIHTNNNAALVVAALILGGRDLERGITIAVMGGWDTDCNGATVGSIVGAMVGAKQLPSKWTAPLNDTLYAEVTGYHPITISECARRSLDIVKRAR